MSKRVIAARTMLGCARVHVDGAILGGSQAVQMATHLGRI